MIVLGISGFEQSIPFKKLHWPNLDDREYRISQGHDSAAALFIDGELIAAAAEERFSRKKHTGDFPIGAISYCLAEGGVTLGDVDEIVHSFDFAPHRAVYSFDPITAALYRDVYSREAVLAQVTRYLDGYPGDRVGHVDNHLDHAASAYFCSGWDECLVVVVDGMGEVESASGESPLETPLAFSIPLSLCISDSTSMPMSTKSWALRPTATRRASGPFSRKRSNYAKTEPSVSLCFA